MKPFRSFTKILATAGGAIALLAASAVGAQTITNVAQASWSAGGTNFSATSNAVSFAVTQIPATLQTFSRSPSSNQSLPYTPALCGGVPIQLPGDSGAGQGTIGANPTSEIRPGETLIIRMDAPSANLSPTSIDKVEYIITSPTGDRETLTAFETAPNSGMFVAAIATHLVPPQPTQGDCRLGVSAGGRIKIVATPDTGPQVIIEGEVSVLADPYGLVFDSEDGSVVNGARVTIVDSATGAPAHIFAEDGVTTWPSTVISGQSVTDGAGNVYPLAPGEFRFPLAAVGSYRLVIEPPAPYSAPSTATPAQLTGLTRPDGGAFVLAPASFGGTFAVVNTTAVRIDVPLDRPPVSVSLFKSASRATAQPGDVVFYTIEARNPDSHLKRSVVVTDQPSDMLRLRPDTIRIDGAAAPGAIQIAPDGHQLVATLGDLAPGQMRRITYAMSVRQDAAPGQAVNRASATDSRGIPAVSSAVVKIEADNLAGRMTVIGRIADGGCDARSPHNGIAGVRVVMEDGSYAITDAEGRYHFDAVVPGYHVVAPQEASLPQGGRFADCNRSVRSAGNASSRFVNGRGGSLAVADFSATVPEQVSVPAAVQPDVATDREAAGGDTDWLALGNGENGFVFPGTDYNPRAPVMRAVVRHRADQKVELTLDGKPVDPLASDGERKSADGSFAVSIWRGLPITGENSELVAVVRNADGSEAGRFTRQVHFASTPAHVELLGERSRLTADGSRRMLVALRVTDRNGRPVHAGIGGEFTLDAPYESAEALDALQQRALTGLGRSAPRWLVKGDDGLAYVELAPTMVSGKLHMRFNFTDGDQHRVQDLETWITPGDQPWTLVGLAEGTVGAQSIADNMERSGRFDSDLGENGRVAFYAKGRVLGRYLLTLAYDSARQRDDTRLLGAIDPRAYYTVYADGSDRRFDAASRNKLYVRIEGRAFYALFGDFDTGLNQTQLARYQRTLTGLKAEGEVGGLHVQAYAARTAQAHRHDEFQGGGISGPYRLTSRAIIANSETVTIEVRDRFRSELVISRRTLTRFLDYSIDLLAGTITFKEPLLSRDEMLNPQFVVLDYEIDIANAAGSELNAGIRADWTTPNGAVRVGASALTDTGAGQGARTDLVAVDMKAKLGQQTEIRAEAGLSRRAGLNQNAWLIEAEHHDGQLDVLAYARSVDADYGIGQLGSAQQGRRKLGIDARYRLNDTFSINASAWNDTSLTDASRRNAAELSAQYRSKDTDARLGVALMRDRLADGSTANSTVLEGAVVQRLANNRLELSAASSIALGTAESLDLPERHRLGARYAVNSWMKLTGSYEIARGSGLDARTARAGFELSPWAGARLTTGLGQQDISEYGKRSFAAFGLTQSLSVSHNLTIDATLDSSRTLTGFSAGRLINPAHPASSGGNLGENGSLAEDFTAITLGGTWRYQDWSATLRGEWRDGELAQRKGVTFGAIRQLGEGSMLGAGFSWTHADAATGSGSSDVFDGAVALAHRPAGSPFAVLAKLEMRADKIAGAVLGEAGPAGRTALTVDGDASSRRLIASVSTNWSPFGHDDDGAMTRRTEIGLFTAVRQNFDRGQGIELRGTSVLTGLDLHIGISDRIEIGGAATARFNLSDHTTNYAIGPQIAFVPAQDVVLTVGYNLSGFKDRDFAAARNTNTGIFAAMRLKFDRDTLGFLGF